jgi:hypothetical protein
MTTKLLTFYDFVRVSAAPRARAKASLRLTRSRWASSAAAGSLFSRTPDTRHLPRLRAPLECRWQIDPMTGALTARWVDPSKSASARAEPEPIGSRRCVRRSRQAARGLSVRSHDARLAA